MKKQTSSEIHNQSNDAELFLHEVSSFEPEISLFHDLVNDAHLIEHSHSQPSPPIPEKGNTWFPISKEVR
jgi:hypothetical protein